MNGNPSAAGGDPPTSPFPPGSEGWHDALEAHCERFLGPCPTALGEIVPGPVPLTLYPHLPSAERPWLTVRTGGVSDYPMAVPKGTEERRHCELLSYLPANWELERSEEEWWPAALLKQLGNFVHEHSSWFGEGHTVVVSEPGETYAPGTLPGLQWAPMTSPWRLYSGQTSASSASARSAEIGAL